MGLYIGRKELFVTSETHLRFWVKVLIIAAICFAPLYSLKEQIMAIGENVKIRRFARFQLGEGIEKKQENFAEEVAAQMK